MKHETSQVKVIAVADQGQALFARVFLASLLLLSATTLLLLLP